MRRKSKQIFPTQWQGHCIGIGLLMSFHIINSHTLRHRKEDFEIWTAEEQFLLNQYSTSVLNLARTNTHTPIF